jgi:hypothetical protein
MEDQDIDDRIILMNHKEQCIDMKCFIWPVTDPVNMISGP